MTEDERLARIEDLLDEVVDRLDTLIGLLALRE